PAAAEGDTALLHALDRADVARRSRVDVVRVLVIAADSFVQVEELLPGDGSGVQRGETVLNAYIVEGSQRESGSPIDPEDVARNIVDGGARARRIPRISRSRWNIPVCDRHDRVPRRGDVPRYIRAIRDRVRPARLVCRVEPRPPDVRSCSGRYRSLVPRYRHLLGVREARGIGGGEVVRQQMAVRSRERNRHRVREGAGDEDAVDQTGKCVAVLQARVGAAGATDDEWRARKAE